MNSQNIDILQQHLFNVPISGEVTELFKELECNINSIIQSLRNQKNDIENKKNIIDSELSKHHHLLFLNNTNPNKNETLNMIDISNALLNLQYATHKTIREINMEIVSLKCDVEIMEHDLGLYKNSRVNNDYELSNIYIKFPSDDNV